MFLNAKNENIRIGDTDCDFISFGTGSEPLLMIPGVGDGLKTAKGIALPFAAMYRKYAKDFTVYVLSRRNGIPEGFTTADMANDAAYIMEQRGIGPAHVYGVSQGGMIAMQLAIRHPDKVKSLVLAVTASRPNDLMRESIEGWKEILERGDYAGFMRDDACRCYTGSYLARGLFMNRLAALAKPRDLTRFYILCDACLAHDCYDQLDRIQCPTLILGAGRDRVLGPQASVEMREKIPGSRLHIYRGYSHGVYEQAPDFDDRVIRFCASHKGAAEA
ncbi:MAG: alpha/beta hydrolase [Lachnospiraceae bacterium]|nr:alpha/beta hydrolase [Lachnospiraceae bacterium]